MRICDSCKQLATQHVEIVVIMEDVKDNSEAIFDFCDKCAEQANVNAFRIGVQEIIKHAVNK